MHAEIVGNVLRGLRIAPIGNTDSYRIAFNSNLTVGTNNGMLGNDLVCSSTSNTVVLASTRVGAPQLVHVQSVTNPSHGQLLYGSDGSFSYTPNSGFVGADSFTYVINDNNVQPPGDAKLLKFTTGPVTVNILVNAPPVAPTLSQWGLLALLALLGGVAAISLRKRFA